MKKFPFYCGIVVILFSACQKTEYNTHPVTSAITSIGTDIVNSKDVSSLILPRSDDYPSIPQDPKNPITAEKVELGKLLFNESRLGATPKQTEGLHTYSCATCHHAEAGFQSGLSQGISEGGNGFGITGELRVPSPLYNIANIDVQPIRTPTVLNSAYSEVILWNGSLGGTGVNIGTEANWKVADGTNFNLLGMQGLEGGGIAALKKHRLTPDTAWLASVPEYKNLFDLSFPDLPENQRISSQNVSLAMAAYQRTLLPNQAPFQRYLQGDTRAMSADMIAGMNLFFGKAKCAKCHTGPALNSMQFFALGMADMQQGINGAFNINQGNVESKGRGGFTGKTADLFKFKVPQLYNLKDVNFFGHGGNFTTIEQVIRYKNAAVSQNSNVPASQLAKQFVPLHLTDDEINKLVAFVRDALYDPNLSRYVPESLPSGSCIPNNDTQSRIDRGCQ